MSTPAACLFLTLLLGAAGLGTVVITEQLHELRADPAHDAAAFAADDQELRNETVAALGELRHDVEVKGNAKPVIAKPLLPVTLADISLTWSDVSLTSSDVSLISPKVSTTKNGEFGPSRAQSVASLPLRHSPRHSAGT
jgi:hypothetical protein